ncbi:DUF397 domain-containing protein [Paractinoplanes atraurantiacus]|uniref:DUF397 domain-containing protein n=1 Tax=Paractinoplanes atraurantiacus TaxID=1036182 RepID=A0A285IT51_9ACTN|nr:DUF397 domain-containing protein [Actinoplanes atraurantiacus]SNY50276.1 protein of unknown function [Actinoplanes atraurantiacus]
MNPLGAEWRKSMRSAQGNCVEVSYRADQGAILVRDTKAEGRGPVLTFTRSEWSAFVAGVNDGEFNLPD